jgi:hypothetical protein
MSDFEQRLLIALDPVRRALAAVVAVLDHGRARHPQNDGFEKSSAFHIERTEGHLAALRAGDRSEPHLSHAAARLLLALQAQQEGR